MLSFIPRCIALLGVLATAMAGMLLTPRESSAHPLGEMTINHYSEITFTEDQVRIYYVIDFAELSALEQILRIDGAEERSVEGADLDSYLGEVVPEFLDGLQLTVADQPVSLSAVSSHAEFTDGNWGFDLLRVEIEAVGDLPEPIESDVSGHYLVRNFPGRLGWHEVVMPRAEEITVLETDALRESVSDELRDYPEVTEQEPLQIYDVEFTLVPGGESDSDGAPGAIVDVGEGEAMPPTGSPHAWWAASRPCSMEVEASAGNCSSTMWVAARGLRWPYSSPIAQARKYASYSSFLPGSS
jgi:nickel/cobalt transporter (NicO) family protein